MIKVITYGTYDMLHYGHIKLLERAKALGDYLIVGVTSDDFDKARGKINVRQSLMERIEAIKNIGLADEIIIEEYEGQKIDDIKRLNVDIFTVGSDWRGHFDYLNEYCKVVYLDRTEGISSSDIRTKKNHIKLGLVGKVAFLKNFSYESQNLNIITKNYDELLEKVDAVYIISAPSKHYTQIKKALECGKHALCESPIALKIEEVEELFSLAKEKNLVLTEALRIAYSMAYSRMLLLLKGGLIGNVVSVDSVCTSIRPIEADDSKNINNLWNSICSWGPTALLPIFQILGTKYNGKLIVSNFADAEKMYDNFTKISMVYPHAVASIKVGQGVKSEGELVISGTKGYVYVPAPWWKMDYFEVRYENSENNRRYFYQLDGEGIRYELVNFIKAINTGGKNGYIESCVSEAITKIINDFYQKKDFIEI